MDKQTQKLCQERTTIENIICVAFRAGQVLQEQFLPLSLLPPSKKIKQASSIYFIFAKVKKTQTTKQTNKLNTKNNSGHSQVELEWKKYKEQYCCVLPA